MRIDEAAEALADQAYEEGREVKDVFMRLRKKKEGPVWETIATLPFFEQMDVLDQAEEKYGV